MTQLSPWSPVGAVKRVDCGSLNQDFGARLLSKGRRGEVLSGCMARIAGHLHNNTTWIRYPRIIRGNRGSDHETINRPWRYGPPAPCVGYEPYSDCCQP